MERIFGREDFLGARNGGFFERDFFDYEIVEREERRGEEKVAHELGLEGETVWMREAEGLVGATGTEKKIVVEKDICEALEPAKYASEEGGELEDFEELALKVGRGVCQNYNNIEDAEPDEPNEAGG